MNDFLINKYINNITINNINEFTEKEGIFLKNEEALIINSYIKKYWKIFYYENPDNLFKELKLKLEPSTYKKIIELYYKYKKKIKNT